MKFLLLLILPSSLLAADRITEARNSISALIQPLMPGSANKPQAPAKFRVDGCGKYKLSLGNLLLKTEAAEMEFKFKVGCDVQGKVKPELFQSFPAKLELRHLENFDWLETENKIVADLQVKPILRLEMRNGLLKGKGSTVRFEADYRVRPGTPSEKMISQNLGGELRISEIDGKKVSIKEKILVK